jgi:ATP-binding protein involved in chromosome partitioning
MDDRAGDFESTVREALRSVVDPELGIDIVEAGMFKGAELDEDGKAVVRVALTIAGCPLRGTIQQAIEARVAAVDGVTDVEVEMAEMTSQERSSVMDRVRRLRHDNPEVTTVPPNTRVVAIASGKGGVGKSTLSVNIASELALRNYDVGLLDADIWGFSIPHMLGVSARLTGKDGMIEPHRVPIGDGSIELVSTGLLVDSEEQALMWRGLVLSRALEQFLQDVRWGPMDYLVVDLPPGTGDIQMALSRLLPSSEVVVVTTPQRSAMTVASRVANMARRSYLHVLGVVENMSAFICDHGSRYDIFGARGGEELSRSLGVPLIGSVPFDPALMTAADHGIPLVVSDPDSRSASAIREIVDRVCCELIPPLDDASCTAKSPELAVKPV